MTYVPRGRHCEEFAVGEAFTTAARTVTEGTVDRFAGLSGDFNPLHTDEESARQGPMKGRIAHGMLVLTIATGQANQLGLFEGTTPALLACYHRVPAVLGLLRARGAVLDAFEATAAGDVTRLAALLGEAPGLVSTHAGDGWTPLHLAAHFGETPAVALLLAHGGDPRARSRNPLENTPLHAGLAGTAGLDLVDRLLSAGAEVNAVDGGGFTPLHIAASGGSSPW